MSDQKSAPTDTQPKVATSISATKDPEKDGEGKKLPQLGALEDDDEFEVSPLAVPPFSLPLLGSGWLFRVKKWRLLTAPQDFPATGTFD